MSGLNEIISHALIVLTNHSHLQLLCSVLIIVLGFPDSSVGKASACNAGDPCLIRGLGRSPGEGKATYFSILAWIIPWTVQTIDLQFYLGSKITADGECSHEIKRRLLLGRKVMTNLDSIFKSRDIILLRKVRIVKAMVFPVVVYGCKSWTIQKAEC